MLYCLVTETKEFLSWKEFIAWKEEESASYSSFVQPKGEKENINDTGF